MPDREKFPPLPNQIMRDHARILRETKGYASLRRRIESGQATQQHSTNPDEDRLLRLRALLESKQADPTNIEQLRQEVKPPDNSSFVSGLFKKLEQAALPFEAFAEGVSAVVGGLIPQEAFRERSARSRKVLGALFTGDMNIADAAGALREVHRERSSIEQFITGALFDPINFVLPGASLVRTGVKSGVKAGLAAAGRSTIDTALPFVGPRLRRAVGDRFHTSPDALRMELAAVNKQLDLPPIAGGADALPEEEALVQAIDDGLKHLQDTPPTGEAPTGTLISKLLAGTKNSTEEALLRLTYDTAGRPFEVPNLLVRDVSFSTRRVTFFDLKTHTQARGSARLNDKTLSALRRHIKDKGLRSGDALFPVRGDKTKPSGIRGYNTIIERIAKNAGLNAEEGSALKGNAIRKLAATDLADVLITSGTRLTLVSRLLGHKITDLKTAIDRYIKLDRRFPDMDAYKRLVEVKPSMKANLLALRRAEAQYREALAKSKSKGAIAFLPSLRAKGKVNTLASAKNNLFIERGRSMVDSLQLSPERLAGLGRANPSKSQKLAVEDILRAAEAHSLLIGGRVLDDAYALNISQLKKGSPERAAVVAERRALGETLTQISLGLQDLEIDRLAKSASLAGTILRKFLTEDEAKLIENARRGAVDLAQTILADPEHLRFRVSGITARQLAERGLSQGALASKGVNFLNGLEDASDAVRAKLVQQWINYPGMKSVFEIDKKFNLIGDTPETLQFQETTQKLRRAFLNMMAPRKATQQLFGLDIRGARDFEGGEDFGIRVRRADALVSELVAQGRVAHPETLPGKMQARLDKLAETPTSAKEAAASAGEEVPPIEPPPPTSQAGEFIEHISPKTTLSIEEAHDVQVRPWARYAQWSDSLRHDKAAPDKSFIGIANPTAVKQGVSWFGRRGLEFLTMRGASAIGVTRASIAYNRVKQVIIDNSAAAYHELNKTSGGRWVTEHFNATTGFFDDTLVVKKVLDNVGNLAPRIQPEDAMRHPIALFDGQRGVPTARLGEFYDLTNEQREIVLLAREWVKRGTDLALLRGMSKKRLAEILGQEPSPDYFPSITDKMNMSQVETMIGKHMPGEDFGWTYARAHDDLRSALQSRRTYVNPLMAAFNYHATVQMKATDDEFLRFLSKQGLTESFKKYENLESAATTLKRVKDIVLAQGRRGVTLKEQERLRDLAKIKTEGEVADQLRNMGALVDDVMRSRESAEKVSPVIDDIWRRTTEKLEAERALKKDVSDIPGLSGVLFKDSVEASRAREFFKEGNENLAKLFRIGNTSSSVLRFLQAGMDISVLAIHGLVSLTSNPRQWGQATEKMLRTLIDPEVFKAYVTQNFDAMNDFRYHGGMLGNQASDVTEAASTVTSLFEMMGLKPLAGLSARAELAFTTWQDVARTELWSSMRHLTGGDSSKLTELAAHVNKLTGVYNPVLAGVPQLQRHIEGSLVSFAPMYRRAAFGLIVSALRKRNSLEARLAQNALGKFAFAMTIMFGLLPKISGNNPDSLNLTKPQFMTYKAGDTYIGVGTAYYSLVRTIASVTQQALSPEKRGGFATLNVVDNTLLRWWRSQAPPLPQVAIDIALGRSYIGEPLRGDDGEILSGGFAEYALLSGVPMIVENIYEELMREGSFNVGVLSEFIGGRTFPQSLKDRRLQLANNLLVSSVDPNIGAWRRHRSREEKPLTYEDMPRLLQTRLTQQSPELQYYDEQIEKDELTTGNPKRVSFVKYKQETTANRRLVDDKLAGVAREFMSGGKSGRQFVQLVNEWGGKLAILQETTSNRPEFTEVQEAFDEAKKRQAADPDEFWGDVLYNEFVQKVLFNPTNENENGIFQPDEYAKAEELFWKAYGLPYMEYIQERRRADRQLPDEVKSLFEARDRLRPYWQLVEEVSTNLDDTALLKNYLSLPSRDRPRFKLYHPRVAGLEHRLDYLREHFRLQNPELDWFLVKYYDNSPRTPFARKQLREWQDLQQRLTGTL